MEDISFIGTTSWFDNARVFDYLCIWFVNIWFDISVNKLCCNHYISYANLSGLHCHIMNLWFVIKLFLSNEYIFPAFVSWLKLYQDYNWIFALVVIKSHLTSSSIKILDIVEIFNASWFFCCNNFWLMWLTSHHVSLFCSDISLFWFLMIL